MDAIADELDLDPLELRKRNLIQPAKFPYRPHEHPLFRWCSGDYPAIVARTEALINYAE